MERVRSLSPYMEGKKLPGVVGQNTAFLKYLAGKGPNDVKE